MSAEYGRERGFDVDWRYGRKAEQLVKELCGLADDGKIQLEVKRKRRHDGYFYVELEHDPGRRDQFKPSGLTVTTAEVWAFAVADSGVALMVQAEYLREAIKRNYGSPAKRLIGSCPTRGRLLSIWDILAAATQKSPSRAQFGDDFHVIA